MFKLKIQQLTMLHWLILGLAIANAITPFVLTSGKKPVVVEKEIEYPADLATIVLFDSQKYVQAALTQDQLEEAHGKAKENTVARKEKEVVIPTCYELGPFVDKEEARSVQRQLEKYDFHIQYKSGVKKEIIGYWVFLPPERSRALGRLKVEEVKLKGLTDVMLLTNNSPKLAISLGLFKDKMFANKRLLKAQSLGLDAKMEIRYKDQDNQWLLIETTQKQDLPQDEWLNILHGLQNIELKTVNCH